MREEEIEHHLGLEVATAIRQSIEAAYVTAAGAPDAEQKIDALRWHLLSMLAATITVPGDEDRWRTIASECSDRLTQVVDEVWLANGLPSGIAPRTWRRQ